MSCRPLALLAILLPLGCADLPPALPAGPPPAPPVASGFVAATTPAPTATPAAGPTPSDGPSPAASAPPAATRRYTCDRGETSVLVPVEARDARGLPLPGALAVGARVDVLPVLRGRPARALMGDPLGAAGEPDAVYALEDVTIAITTATPVGGEGPGVPHLAGARVTARGGLTVEAARAWLQAMAPCYAVPDLTKPPGGLGENGRWQTWFAPEASLRPAVGLMHDGLEIYAARRADDDWRRTGAFAFGAWGDEPGPTFPDPGPVPEDRWAGVLVFGLWMGK